MSARNIFYSLRTRDMNEKCIKHVWTSLLFTINKLSSFCISIHENLVDLNIMWNLLEFSGLQKSKEGKRFEFFNFIYFIMHTCIRSSKD